MTDSHTSKWKNILSRLVITTIPYEYVSKITIYSNNKAYTVSTKEEFDETIQKIIKTNNSTYLSLLNISFDVDFDSRKFKKEVKNRVDTLFSKFFKS